MDETKKDGPSLEELRATVAKLVLFASSYEHGLEGGTSSMLSDENKIRLQKIVDLIELVSKDVGRRQRDFWAIYLIYPHLVRVYEKVHEWHRSGGDSGLSDDAARTKIHELLGSLFPQGLSEHRLDRLPLTSAEIAKLGGPVNAAAKRLGKQFNVSDRMIFKIRDAFPETKVPHVEGTHYDAPIQEKFVNAAVALDYFATKILDLNHDEHKQLLAILQGHFGIEPEPDLKPGNDQDPKGSDNSRASGAPNSKTE